MNNQKQKKLAYLFLPLLVLLSACSIPGISSDSSPVAPKNLELFMSRSIMGDIEFEQYKLIGSQLYKECGNIRRGRFIPDVQEMVTIENSGETDISEDIGELYAAIAHSNSTFDPPGKNTNLADPGQLYLTIDGTSPLKIKTSIDSVSDARTVPQERLAKLTRTVRELAGGTMCESTSFHGL